MAMKGKIHGILTRRHFLGGAVGGATALATSGIWAKAPVQSLLPEARPYQPTGVGAPASEEIIARAKLGGQVCFVVAEAQTGRVLEVRNPLRRLPPASVTKAFTAQYALEALGPAYSFSTHLIATGPMVNGRIQGDLVLRGGGDPLLDSNGLAEMAKALKSAGVRSVDGQFLVSGGSLPHVARIDPDQPDYLGYNPAVSGLNLNFNRVHFEWKHVDDTWQVAMDARTQTVKPPVTFAQMKIIDRKSPVYTYADEGAREHWTVATSALGNGGSRWLPVREPELYAGEVFQIFARAEGIALKQPRRTQDAVRGTVLVSRQSPPLSRVLKGMLAYSTNLTAEVAGLSATLARGGVAGDLESSAAEMSLWLRRRMALRKPYFLNHSGLSDRNRVCTSDIVQFLLRTGPDSTLASILKPMRLRDEQGNLSKRQGYQVHAKTGTLNFVSALAGFVRGPGGKPLAFAMLSADMPRRAALPREERENPRGEKGWNTRAHRMQWALINRWIERYGL